jgi:HSP20 family molecular chaperone IbpA
LRSEGGDIEPFDWFRRFFGSRTSNRQFGFSDIFRGLEEMRSEMERQFEEQFKNFESIVPRELVREFGNVRLPSLCGGGGFSFTRPLISSERERLADITTSNTEVKVILEMSGVSKDKIRINAYDNSVEIKSDDPQRNYHEVINLPPEADVETAKSTYKNGILEIVFKKREQTKPKGKEVKVE